MLIACSAAACASPAAGPPTPAPAPERLPLRVVADGFVDHSRDDEADGVPSFPRDVLPSDFSLCEHGYGVVLDQLRPVVGAPGSWELVELDASGRTLGAGVRVPRERVEDLYLLAIELSRGTGLCRSGRMDAVVMVAAGLRGRPDFCGDDPRAPSLAERFDALVLELGRSRAR